MLLVKFTNAFHNTLTFTIYVCVCSFLFLSPFTKGDPWVQCIRKHKANKAAYQRILVQAVLIKIFVDVLNILVHTRLDALHKFRILIIHILIVPLPQTSSAGRALLLSHSSIDNQYSIFSLMIQQVFHCWP